MLYLCTTVTITMNTLYVKPAKNKWGVSTHNTIIDTGLGRIGLCLFCVVRVD